MKPNEIRRTYRWMAPVYDLLFRRAYRRMRGESINGLALEPSDAVVLVGVGTGLDLPLLPPVSRTVAVDLSPAMLHPAIRTHPAASVDFALADGARLPLRDRSAPAVILHLVLSVAPDPGGVLRETARILRPGGRVAILDHFAPAGRLSVARRVLARMPLLLGTHLDRRFEDMVEGLPFRVLADRRFARGLYRALVLELADDGPLDARLPPAGT